jgi:hypothetical protein
MTFKIEKGIPLAPISREGTTVYPWDQMEDGDSFLVPKEDAPEGKSISASGNAWCKRHRPDFYVSQRSLPEGIRVYMFKSKEEEEK